MPQPLSNMIAWWLPKIWKARVGNSFTAASSFFGSIYGGTCVFELPLLQDTPIQSNTHVV